LLNEPLLTCGLLTPVEIDEEERVSRKARKGNLRAFHAKLAKPAKEIPRKPSYLTRELSSKAPNARKENPTKVETNFPQRREAKAQRANHRRNTVNLRGIRKIRLPLQWRISIK
jgi:hypothetical protein